MTRLPSGKEKDVIWCRWSLVTSNWENLFNWGTQPNHLPMILISRQIWIWILISGTHRGTLAHSYTSQTLHRSKTGSPASISNTCYPNTMHVHCIRSNLALASMFWETILIFCERRGNSVVLLYLHLEYCDDITVSWVIWTLNSFTWTKNKQCKKPLLSMVYCSFEN